MSEQSTKVNPLNQILMGVLTVCSFLISIIFWGIKDDLGTIKKDLDIIKIEVQKVKDKEETHADAINKLDRGYDYLLKVKQDKRKEEP